MDIKASVIRTQHCHSDAQHSHSRNVGNTASYTVVVKSVGVCWTTLTQQAPRKSVANHVKAHENEKVAIGAQHRTEQNDD